VHRPTCRKADAEMRDNFRLRRWIEADADRRAEYLSFCRDCWKMFIRRSDHPEPSEDTMVSAIILMLKEDVSFETFARGRRSTILSEDAGWDRLYRAGATMVLDEYLEARDDGGWS
jgi:hypothetical protein